MRVVILRELGSHLRILILTVGKFFRRTHL